MTVTGSMAVALIYTASRIGAVAGLKLGSFIQEGNQRLLRFLEKGGKVRDIPVRDDLERYLTAYLDGAGLPVSSGWGAAVSQAYAQDAGAQSHGDDGRRHAPDDQTAHEKH
jgi:hypothetical protein